MYFVVECSTMSAPSANGCCRAGEAKVLSTNTFAPAAEPSWAIPAISAMVSSGLVGVSTQISLVLERDRRAHRVEVGQRGGRVRDRPSA